ncbi:MAG: hypothetical protein ACKO66_01635, partial [Flavobacteriales bacterium]
MPNALDYSTGFCEQVDLKQKAVTTDPIGFRAFNHQNIQNISEAVDACRKLRDNALLGANDAGD